MTKKQSPVIDGPTGVNIYLHQRLNRAGGRPTPLQMKEKRLLVIRYRRTLPFNSSFGHFTSQQDKI